MLQSPTLVEGKYNQEFKLREVDQMNFMQAEIVDFQVTFANFKANQGPMDLDQMVVLYKTKNKNLFTFVLY